MNDFETLIDDWVGAERAGVFSKTPQPVMRSAVTASSRSKLFLVSPRWAIAAALVMAAGVWTMMFRTNLSDLQNRSRIAQLAKAIDLQSALASCVGGPSGALDQYCGRVDFDGDGDADLRDFGKYQRDLAGTSR
jgi:hypothetical protein